MSSLALSEDGDLVLADEGADLVVDETLVAPVLASLFFDAFADDVPAAEQRGWWADSPEDRVGSLLWLLEQGKADQATAAAAWDHAEAALRWVVDEGIADSVNDTTSLPGGGALCIEITLTRGSAARWSSLWDGFEDVERPWNGSVIRLRRA